MKMVTPSWRHPPLETLADDPRVPKPVGFQVLVLVPPAEDRTAGGIVLPDAARDREQTGSMLARVVALGPDAYRDGKRFPTGHYCEQGDWVVLPPYAGIRLKITLDDGDHEVRLVNDDTISATVADPFSIARK